MAPWEASIGPGTGNEKTTHIYEESNQIQRFVVAEQRIKAFIEKHGMGRDWSEFL